MSYFWATLTEFVLLVDVVSIVYVERITIRSRTVDCMVDTVDRSRSLSYICM